MTNKLLRACLKGVEVGLVASVILIGGLEFKREMYERNFKNWLDDTKKERSVSITEEYKDTNNLNGAFICTFNSRKIERSEPLFTDYIGTCCALALDNKVEGSHYLGHFSAADDWREIRTSIRTEFPDLKNLKDFKRLEPIVIEGSQPNNLATRNVYRALKSLDLLKEARYCRSERVLIKAGEFYSVKW